MKTILTISLFASLWVFSGVARSAIIVLDNTNGWQDFLEPGASIQQSDAPDNFSITGTNVEFAIGSPAQLFSPVKHRLATPVLGIQPHRSGHGQHRFFDADD